MKMRKNILVLVMACFMAFVSSVSLSQTVFAAPGAQPGISMEDAKKIALDHAGVSAGDVTFTKLEFERKYGGSEYEIAFIWNDIRHKYEIDADSGAIREYSRKERKQSRWNGTVADSGDYIGIDAAKAIALKHAGVPAAQAEFTKVKLDRDKKRGTAEYEIGFFADGKKYKCEIGALNGEVLEYSVKTLNNRW